MTIPLSLAWILAACLSAAAQDATLQGVLTDKDGHPVPRGKVIVRRLSPEGPDRTVETDVGGAFTARVPAGRYLVLYDIETERGGSDYIKAKPDETITVQWDKHRRLEKSSRDCNHRTEITKEILAAERDLSFALTRTGCFGSCPIFNAHLLPDGTLVYHGVDFVKVKGTLVLRRDPQLARRLLKKAVELGLFEMCSEYQLGVTDEETVILNLRVSSESKQILDYGGAAPEAFSAFVKSAQHELGLDALIANK